MKPKTQKAFAAVVEVIAQQSIDLSRGDYIALVEELAGHIQCLQDCIREEEEENEP